MEAFGSYLLKSAIWLTGFAIVYFIFLRNERYFMLKRIYLISGILISFIFPLISFHYKVEMPAQVISQAALSGASGSAIAVQLQDVAGKPFNYRFILLFLYLSGMILLLFRAIRHFSSIFKIINKANINRQGPAKLIRASQFPASFSFFNYVFINPSVCEIEAEEILNHEIVHVRQKHWFDLLLVEILRLIQWVNPFAWIYTRFIRLNHEYLADQVALQRSASPANYRAALMNQLFDSPVISLSNSFNYSLNKKRFDMMKKIITSPYRKVKVLIVIPVVAIFFYAFATPEYHYAPRLATPMTIYKTPVIVQNEVKGIVVRPDGEPLKGASIISTGTAGNSFIAFTGTDGKFSIKTTPDASLLITCKGYKGVTLKPSFTSEMEVRLAIDPDYTEVAVVEIKTQPQKTKQVPSPTSEQAAVKHEPGGTNPVVVQEKPKKAIFIDGAYTDKSFSQINTELGHNWGIMKPFSAKEGLEKYGEQGKNGGFDIITRKKALEMGLNPPYPRIDPEDYPTFQGQGHGSFNDWLLGQVKYPEDAVSRGVSGTVSASYTVNPDGTLTNPGIMYSPDKSLGDAVVKAIASSPQWEPPKNPESTDPFKASVSIKFELPDNISIPEEPFVVVEEMPMFPGGDVALLKYIADDTRYPESAKAGNITGRVIIRFVVNKEGKTEEATVLRGVDPSLDAEAIRVVNSLPTFSPGKQGGKPVPVYYMVPITFSLAKDTVKINP